eukprot:9252332-Pyramimonas_sp.AAC.2
MRRGRRMVRMRRQLITGGLWKAKEGPEPQLTRMGKTGERQRASGSAQATEEFHAKAKKGGVWGGMSVDAEEVKVLHLKQKARSD